MRGRFSTLIRRLRSADGRRTRWLRRAVVAAVVGAALLTGGTVASVGWVRGGAEGHIFAEQDVPEAPVALVLGTKVHPDGTPSPFLTARLEIAQRLLTAGKVRAILLSGDNMNPDYDEPTAMRRWLLGQGVPAEKVVLDYAGFDTYDSCARAKRIFGVERATVVTQSFHLPRAVAVCRRLGVDASGVGDETAREYGRTWRISSTREYGACVKAAVDLLSGRDPVHLGRRETGVEDALRA
ncbi:vancomycin high temperature exclusion protein [Micromonospora sp. MW-13]|uniref:SanA/YdcF family protein n=1 Tax=Micromonospora sp. MW-13 TaxID=2094022 RepID=UPI000E448F41|nr:ElyC/SanA/YdcF family protein [Micromonospora sp. MW-13]RGC70387.1 vancomycin high temperature exclusion protein [Micromonospora sp. MW-13]